MTTMLLETSRWRLRFRGSDPITPRTSAAESTPTDPFGYRHRRAAIVEAVALISDVALLSSALDPSNGSIRIELLAPLLSTPDQLALEAQLQSAANHDGRNDVTIDFEFVDPPSTERIGRRMLS